MKTLRDTATVVALLTLAFCAGSTGCAAIHAARAIAAIEADVHGVTEKLNSDLDALGTDLKIFNGVLGTVQTSVASIQSEADEQGVYWTAIAGDVQMIAGDTDLALDAMATTMRNLDTSMNAVAIPQISASLTQAVNSLNTNLNKLTADTEPVLKNAALTLGDPQIAKSLANIQEATANVAVTSKHVEETTRDLETYTHRLVAPASLARQAVITIVRYVTVFFGAFWGAK